MSSSDGDVQSPNPSLRDLYHRLLPLTQHEPGQLAAKLLNMSEFGFGHYQGSPDIWHNIATIASRAGLSTISLAILRAGLAQWPNDIDLLCGVLQHYYSVDLNRRLATATWKQIEKQPFERRRIYWRYWVYGSNYYREILHDYAGALSLLDRGLQSVAPDSLADVIRQYRAILVDTPPARVLGTSSEMKRYQKKVFKQLEDKYLLGLRLGVEGAYTLAVSLAVLYQEHAFRLNDTPGSLDYLNSALACLDQAERLYTADLNHPISEIYEAKARILAALDRHSEALQLLVSLPLERRREPSIQLMMRYAARVTGEALPEGDDSDLSPATQEAQSVLEELFSEQGRALLRLAQESPAIAGVILHVAGVLAREGGGRG